MKTELYAVRCEELGLVWPTIMAAVDWLKRNGMKAEYHGIYVSITTGAQHFGRHFFDASKPEVNCDWNTITYSVDIETGDKIVIGSHSPSLVTA